MTSADSSAAELRHPVGGAAVLAGRVGVCVDRPLLSLDREFTYELPSELGAGVGSLVQVPFHGRATRGWILGPTQDEPQRILEVRKAVSPARAFDERGLELLRWVSERYVAPLAAVIARAVPPRVVAEEEGRHGVVGWQRGPDASVTLDARPLTEYGGGGELAAGAREGSGAFVMRPAPEDEQAVCVETVAACLAGGRRAIVLVPESVPLPATAAAVRDTVGDRAAALVGG